MRVTKNFIFGSFYHLLPLRQILIHIRLLWGKPGNLLKPVVHIISSVESNLCTFGLLCCFCPGSQKNQHFGSALYIWISNAQAVSKSIVVSRPFRVFPFLSKLLLLQHYIVEFAKTLRGFISHKENIFKHSNSVFFDPPYIFFSMMPLILMKNSNSNHHLASLLSLQSQYENIIMKYTSLRCRIPPYYTLLYLTFVFKFIDFLFQVNYCYNKKTSRNILRAGRDKGYRLGSPQNPKILY